MSGGLPSTPEAELFYTRSLGELLRSGLPFLVGGAYAMREYADIIRDTKDLDLFCKPADAPAILRVLARSGCETEVTQPIWLAKAFCGQDFIDLIYRSGNGLCEVDETWFRYARSVRLLDCDVPLVPPEEMIWSKAFVQYRERFDGTDIHHILRKQGPTLDWQRLLARMDEHWEVLFSHLVTFRFVYPAERNIVPDWLMEELTSRLRRQLVEPPPDTRVCRGTLLGGPHYAIDIEEWGYRDARPQYERGGNGRKARKVGQERKTETESRRAGRPARA